MPGVIEAYEGLLDIAARGREFFHGEVYYPAVAADDPRMSQSVGHGYDFTRAIPMLDTDGVTPLEGTASLRILRMVLTDDTFALFMRTRLKWVSSYGEHESYAHYELTPEAATRLSHTYTPAEPTRGYPEWLMEALDEAISYGADWLQTVPAELISDFGAPAYSYHEACVVAAQQAEPLLLCMLADTDLGVVEPGELCKLIEWIAAQPEVA